MTRFRFHYDGPSISFFPALFLVQINNNYYIISFRFLTVEMQLHFKKD